MKKLIASFLVSVIAIGGFIYIKYAHAYEGVSYYTQIIDQVSPEKQDNKYVYNYLLDGYNDKGQRQVLDIDIASANDEKQPLAKDAYLVVTYNEDKGVLNYKEVDKTSIPQKALTLIEENAKVSNDDEGYLSF